MALLSGLLKVPGPGPPAGGDQAPWPSWEMGVGGLSWGRRDGCHRGSPSSSWRAGPGGEFPLVRPTSSSSSGPPAGAASSASPPGLRSFLSCAGSRTMKGSVRVFRSGHGGECGLRDSMSWGWRWRVPGTRWVIHPGEHPGGGESWPSREMEGASPGGRTGIVRQGWPLRAVTAGWRGWRGATGLRLGVSNKGLPPLQRPGGELRPPPWAAGGGGGCIPWGRGLLPDRPSWPAPGRGSRGGAGAAHPGNAAPVPLRRDLPGTFLEWDGGAPRVVELRGPRRGCLGGGVHPI